VVVELGPGTGAVSAVIAERMPKGGRHLAVELDPTMVAYLEATRPGLEVIHGNAAHLRTLLAERDIERVDAIICGLPWALFDDATQAELLAGISAAVGPTGAFTTFAYLHGMTLTAARRFRASLRATFDEVLISSTVWRNLPPAFVYVCRRPRAAVADE
jgi:phospholipid N-methyltransferase